MPKNVKGIFTSIITPFKKNSLEIDFDSLMDLVGFISDNKASGIIPFDIYGEFTSLSNSEKKQILNSIMESREEMLIIPHITSYSYSDTIDLAHYAQGIGVNALLISPPLFYKDIDNESLEKYFMKVLENIDIPVYLYNMPKYTGIAISDDLIDKLEETGKVIGIKDYNDDMFYINNYKNKHPELNIISSNDKLIYDSLNIGIKTFSSNLFNIFPEIVKSIFYDYEQPKGNGGYNSQKYLNEIINIVNNFSTIPALKFLTTLRGIQESDVRPPFFELEQEKKNILKQEIYPYITNPSVIE
ncbi:MAG: 4-hydroxy-tetrahydrodipicolinate synthase [Candidatus Sericytochromatia bacterium]|nr:MAG: 4-hydroxy-tetrahydrodipicolinate synthase [Candidatus Sericytochromatia bacterium]